MQVLKLKESTEIGIKWRRLCVRAHNIHIHCHSSPLDLGSYTLRSLSVVTAIGKLVDGLKLFAVSQISGV